MCNSEQSHWYVLRVPYLRAAKAKQVLDQLGYRISLPTYFRKQKDEETGDIHYVTLACVPNTLFVFGTQSQMKSLFANLTLPPMSFLYDHTKEIDGKNPPVIIPDQEMENFIRVSEHVNKNVVDVSNNTFTYKTDYNVRVTQGDFAGVVGRVAKIFGQTRVVVKLNNLCVMATSYIPAAFMEPVEKES